MSLVIERRVEQDVVILHLRGRATIGSETDRLNDALRREIASGTKRLLVNLSDLNQIDSSGLATLVRSFVSLGCNGGMMKLVAASGRVRDVLEVTQLARAMPCLPDEATALAAFST
jgi:anti-sigma B factor antagonist